MGIFAILDCLHHHFVKVEIVVPRTVKFSSKCTIRKHITNLVWTFIGLSGIVIPHFLPLFLLTNEQKYCGRLRSYW